MSSPFSIQLGHESVGTISFPPPAQGLTATRTAEGVRIGIPALLTLHGPGRSGFSVVLEDLCATFSIRRDGGTMELGTARYVGHLRSNYDNLPITLTWDWPLSAVAVYERIRDGRAPVFSVTVSGHLRYVLAGEAGKEPVSIAAPFHQIGEVGYSRDTWVGMLRKANVHDAVIVEIPFPSDPPTDWDGVWSALKEARDCFDQGGSVGWNNCIKSVRLALERWRDIETANRAPNWIDPKNKQVTDWTKEDRIEMLRRRFHEYANLGPHSGADGWNRDDAMLALSTLTSLLAVRKP
jgi:hypothetical protein